MHQKQANHKKGQLQEKKNVKLSSLLNFCFAGGKKLSVDLWTKARHK